MSLSSAQSAASLVHNVSPREWIISRGWQYWPNHFSWLRGMVLWERYSVCFTLNLIVHGSNFSSKEWRSKDQLFEREVRKYQWRSFVKNSAKKMLVKFLAFILYVLILWLVILARNQMIWVIFLSVSVLTVFVYFVFYRTQKFASNLR